MPNPSSRPPGLSPEKYARLQAEVKRPYRGLRRFVYYGCAVSGGIGVFIFALQAIAGRDLTTTLPNLALQIGVVALMVWLLWLERDRPTP